MTIKISLVVFIFIMASTGHVISAFAIDGQPDKPACIPGETAKFNGETWGCVKDDIEKGVLADLDCTKEQSPKFDGKKWVCEDFSTCPFNMVQVGGFCIDKYEASVWNLEGTIQYGILDKTGIISYEDYGYPCDRYGQNCTNIYAISLPGRMPSAHITWFQAQQACANVGKRLPTNAEWQMAVAGTPDINPFASYWYRLKGEDNPTCNATFPVVPTGSRVDCVSHWGVHDMVGNVWEWVADWITRQQDRFFITRCADGSGWPSSDDWMCLTGDYTEGGVAALMRGGGLLDTEYPTGYNPGGIRAGPFAIGSEPPYYDGSIFSGKTMGFRCAR